jgi:hypothetical protein
VQLTKKRFLLQLTVLEAWKSEIIRPHVGRISCCSTHDGKAEGQEGVCEKGKTQWQPHFITAWSHLTNPVLGES